MFVILRQRQPSAYVSFLPSLGILLTWLGQPQACVRLAEGAVLREEAR